MVKVEDVMAVKSSMGWQMATADFLAAGGADKRYLSASGGSDAAERRSEPVCRWMIQAFVPLMRWKIFNRLQSEVFYQKSRCQRGGPIVARARGCNRFPAF